MVSRLFGKFFKDEKKDPLLLKRNRKLSESDPTEPFNGLNLLQDFIDVRFKASFLIPLLTKQTTWGDLDVDPKTNENFMSGDFWLPRLLFSAMCDT